MAEGNHGQSPSSSSPSSPSRARTLTLKDMPTSIRWKMWLGVLSSSGDVKQWLSETQTSRQRYADLLKQSEINASRYGGRRSSDPTDDPLRNNPLSADTSTSWGAHWERERWRRVIQQDVERLFPGASFFAREKVRDSVVRVLLTWVEASPSDEMRYKQGLHEIAATLYYVVHADAESRRAKACEMVFVEHDTFALLERLLFDPDGRPLLAHFYIDDHDAVTSAPTQTQPLSPPSPARPPVHASLQAAMDVLRLADSQVYAALTKHSVEPALFALRWLRLLFLREMAFDDALLVWDAIFRHHHEGTQRQGIGLALPVVLVAALVIFVRRDLVVPGMDEVAIIGRLMRMPPLSDARSLIASGESLMCLLDPPPPSSEPPRLLESEFDNNVTAASTSIATTTAVTAETFQFGPHIRIDAEQQIFAESKHSVALVNLKPVVPGHVLVAPKRLAARVSELDANELSDLFSLARDVGQTVQSHFNASSLTFTVQDGPEAGQTVPHVHVHVLPRRKGDFEPNDAVYDAVDASENDMGAARSLDDDRKPRSLQEMAAEAAELRKAMM
ncbi:bifunctional bis(5'-adenosyl)-triphosphatase/adenylylsulfatase FHIT [Pseudoscourfieldia marina]